MFRGSSISTKLTLYAIAASAAGVMVAVSMIVLSVAQHRDRVSASLEARVRPIVSLLGAESLDRRELKAVLEVVVSDPQISRAWILDAGRNLFVSVPEGPRPTDRVALGYDPTNLRFVLRTPGGTNVAVRYNEETLYGALWLALSRIGLAMLAVIVTAILFASFAGRWIARPIAELAAIARNIPESGDFQLGEVQVSRDEVGQLSAALGEMLGKVERRERALREARRAAEGAAAEARQMAVQAQATADALAGETEARARAQRQLEQAQKMEALGRLAGGIAHDFNNLLFVIGTYTDELAKRLSGDDSEAIEQVREAVRRATKLTQQLLSFSRQPTGEPMDVDISHMITRMQSLLQRLIGEDILLNVEGANTRLVVRAPEGALESAVMNLVVNARDALPNGGTIRVRIRPEPAPNVIPDSSAPAAERWMMLSVEDDGTGMDEQTRRRAFEPFFTTKAVGEGTGLGLTLVYALCRQLGGQISVDTAVDRGTRFDVLLPLVESDSGFSVDLPSMTPLPSEEGRVLVAEDDPQVRRLVVRVLSRAGFDVEAVEDGQAALERLKEGPAVDLVVSDVIMPKMGGLALADALQELENDVKILFISGYPAHPGQASAPFPPDLPILRKPFTAQALRRLVRRMLGRNPVTPPPFDADERPS